MKIVEEVNVPVRASWFSLLSGKPPSTISISVVQLEGPFSLQQVETTLKEHGLRLANSLEARVGIRDAGLQSRWPITHCEPGIAVLLFTLNEKRERVMVAYPWGVLKKVTNGFFMAVKNTHCE